MIFEIARVLGGLLLLVAGAESLVRGASALAARFGVSALVIGLTVVAFGTSSPELAVTVGSALTGRGDLALGNVIGSNIFNMLAILGVSAMLAPLVISEQLVRLDVPAMIAASVLAFFLALDGSLGRLDGALLVGSGLVYLGLLARAARAGGAGARQAATAGGPAWLRSGWGQTLLVLLGLLLLVGGADLLVDGAVAIAGALGVSPLIIGLTIVAAGTSLPEAATSVMATMRGERDIAVGNAVGSNVFNLLFVLGAAALISGVQVGPGVLAFDFPIMIAAAVAALPVFFTGLRIERWEGTLFVAYYFAYLAFLALSATRHDALDEFRAVMLAFVIPLTAITLGILTWKQWRANGARTDEPRP